MQINVRTLKTWTGKTLPDFITVVPHNGEKGRISLENGTKGLELGL